MTISNVAPIGVNVVPQTPQIVEPKKDVVVTNKGELTQDVAELSTKKVAPPEIGMMRLAFSRLTDEQIDKVNESGHLPENAKFVANGFGGYSICNNFFGLTCGTRKIPEGFELRKNFLGFTVVLPKESEGLFVKAKK